MNWKKIGWRIFQFFLILILNTSSITWLITNVVGNQTVTISIGGVNKEVDVSFWDTLSLKWRVLVLVFAVIGVVLSILFIKLLWKNHREDTRLRREDKQQELLHKEKMLKLMKLEKKLEKKPLSKSEFSELNRLKRELQEGGLDV